ncbi:hypothetical protein BDR07DRAFT_1461976 [Suillus spraguei]|nr:hypothetical protein BDR07DRAFT_1461976 [Suillus spraguei]
MSSCTFPDSGNYMIENADSKGTFFTVENGSVCLKSKDPKSVQVWKLTIDNSWVKFQGVPPDGKEGKVIDVNTGASTLVYGGGILEDFRLENASNGTFRVTFLYYELGMYWKINGNSVAFTSNQTYAANWKLTKCSK